MIRRKPVVIMGIVSMVFCILHRKTNYVVIPMPAGIGYHINILKINAVFSVAALINMLLMLRTSEKKFIKKLEGTDILKEKNCIIGQCIVFGSIYINSMELKNTDGFCGIYNRKRIIFSN